MHTATSQKQKFNLSQNSISFRIPVLIYLSKMSQRRSKTKAYASIKRRIYATNVAGLPPRSPSGASQTQSFCICNDISPPDKYKREEMKNHLFGAALDADRIRSTLDSPSGGMRDVET